MKFKKVVGVFCLAILSSISVMATPVITSTEAAPYVATCCDRMSIGEQYRWTEKRSYTYKWTDSQGYDRTCNETSMYDWYDKICQNCGANHGSKSRFNTTIHSVSSCPRR